MALVKVKIISGENGETGKSNDGTDARRRSSWGRRYLPKVLKLIIDEFIVYGLLYEVWN